MKTYSESERLDFIKDLPRKRSASAVILKNKNNEWLLLRTDYHDGKYTFPGGIVNQYESAWEGAKREVNEEINLDINILKILTIVNISHQTINDEMVIYFFDGGLVSDEEIKKINYSDGEINDHIFVPEKDVLKYLRSNLHQSFGNLKKSFRENKTLLFDIKK